MSRLIATAATSPYKLLSKHCGDARSNFPPSPCPPLRVLRRLKIAFLWRGIRTVVIHIFPRFFFSFRHPNSVIMKIGVITHPRTKDKKKNWTKKEQQEKNPATFDVKRAQLVSSHIFFTASASFFSRFSLKNIHMPTFKRFLLVKLELGRR